MDNCEVSARSASWRLSVSPWMATTLWLALLIAPLAIGLAWGTYFDDSAYITFRYARNLALGRGLTYNGDIGGPALLRSPLYALALSLLARLGIPLLQAGLVLSGLGWGVTAVAMYNVGRAMGRPVGAMVAATLAVFSPAVASTLGTEIPWALALVWIAIASSMGKRWNVRSIALALVLYVRFDWSTLALATLLLVVEWIEGKHRPLWGSLVLAVAVLGYGLLAVLQIVAPLSLPHAGLAGWRGGIQRLLNESELYWLFLPFVGLGLLATTRKTLWAGLLWMLALFLSGSVAASTMVGTLGLFLAGLGIDWGINWIEVRTVARLDRFALAVGLALVAGLPLGIAQASSLLQRHWCRPVVRQELEQRAGDWLHARSEPTATVLGSERVGYLADRSTLAWDGTTGDPEELALFLQALKENPPEYCVSFRSLAWDRLMRTHWFQDAYERLQELESPYDATSPFTVWGYRLRGFDIGEHRPVPLNVHLPGGVDLVGYQYWPDRIQPGDTVSVTLYLEAGHPVSESYYTAVRMISPNDGVGWALDRLNTRTTLTDTQQAGQVVAQRLALSTTTDIPIGAYRLEITAVAPDLESVLRIYQRNDTAALDRIMLGYVLVPWRGKLDLEQAMHANLGNEIRLLGFEAPDSLPPGAELELVLYWEALQPPEEDYVVFVYLLDANGQPVASRDSPPVDGRYPTTRWLPGDVVPDVVRMALDPNTPPGTYQLHMGMYRWPSLERLPVWDEDGVPLADNLLVLQSVEVR